MAQPKPENKRFKHLRASDARALAQLATQATTGVVNIAEGVHQSVWQTLGVKGGKAPGQTGGLTGLVYQSVRSATQLIGKGVDALLTRLQPVLDAADHAAPGTPQREAVLAALNGVLGDRLAESHSALATTMTLRHGGAALDWQALPPDLKITGKVLVLIHGLCMNDLQWQTHGKLPETGPETALGARTETTPGTTPGATPGATLKTAQHPDKNAQTTGDVPFDHGAVLASALGYTPVYVRYNTGLHTSQNGAEFSNLLEQLVTHWPAPVEEISVVAHSMGGLVTRSAVHQATQKATAQFGKSGEFGKTGTSGKAVLRWPSLLKNIVFLGTPHHGAPLERAGNWVDVLLGSTRYSKPFARLAQLRSAGITDLRYGHVLDGDWQGHDRFRKKPDSRVHVPLPESVACFTVAATTAAKQGSVTDRLIGDGLVPLHSALGLHDDPQRSLHFAKKSQLIAYRTNHLQLLSSQEVAQQMVAWLTPFSISKPISADAARPALERPAGLETAVHRP